MAIEEYWNKDFLKWFKENTPKEGLSENTTFSKQFVYDAYVQGRVDEDNSNEWHYVNWKYFADKDCPKSELSSYLVQLKNKDFLICDWETEEGFGCFWDSNLNPIDNDDVSAWKEIVLPKECK